MCLCCKKCKIINKEKGKENLNKSMFILYCFDCKIYFNDEKKYNNHLKKYHNEKI